MTTFTNKDLLKLITTGKLEGFGGFKYEGDAEQLCDDLWDELERGEGEEGDEEEEDFEEDAEEDFDDEDEEDEEDFDDDPDEDEKP